MITELHEKLSQGTQAKNTIKAENHQRLQFMFDSYIRSNMSVTPGIQTDKDVTNDTIRPEDVAKLPHWHVT
eukprot:scaffold602954_cov19-Prasinocladus_malaysianus.AAC.1